MDKLGMKSRVTSMKQRSYKINDQVSDGEDVSHEEQQRQADIESKNMAAKQQEVQQTTHQIQVAEGQSVHGYRHSQRHRHRHRHRHRTDDRHRRRTQQSTTQQIQKFKCRGLFHNSNSFFDFICFFFFCEVEVFGPKGGPTYLNF